MAGPHTCALGCLVPRAPCEKTGRAREACCQSATPCLQNAAAAPRHSRALAVRAWEGGPGALWKAAGWSRLLEHQVLSSLQEPLWMDPQAESGRSPQAQQAPAGGRLASAWTLLPGGGEAPERQLTSASRLQRRTQGVKTPEHHAMPV